MKQIFRWFYCLDIPDALFLVLLATAAYLWLREKQRGMKCWKPVVSILFGCWLAVILLGTVTGRTEGAANSEPLLRPFYSYYLAASGGDVELYRENLMNCVLFYPAGLLGWELLPERWKAGKRMALVAVVMLLVSLGIEYCQYRFGLGLAETDDVIHNTLGALLGSMIGSVCFKRKCNGKPPCSE